jgi:DNA-binding NarL/FixJ family response regulator
VTDVRVLIADDQQLLRASFAVLVGAAAGLEVVGEAGDGLQAVEQATALRPDVVLMDIRMPGLDGIEATRRICGAAPTAGVKVLILTTFDLDAYVFSALRAGASGFLLKDTPAGDLLTAIRVVAGGEALLAPSVTRRLIGEFARQPRPRRQPARPLNGITAREREVLRLIGQGLSNTEIADHLVISIATVKTHVGQLLAKLHARDRAQLVIAAYEGGLVTVG